MNSVPRAVLRWGLAAALLLPVGGLIGQTPAATPAKASDRGGIGDLLVAPTRIVFEGRERAAEVTLINIGPQPATYRISFVNMEMTETGDLKEVEKKPGVMTAEDLVRYSPRQITLEPNVAQVVRMQVRKPAELPDGEYRSHLLFRAVPREDAAPQQNIEAQAGKTDGTGFSIRLTPIYGVSIPVLVRSGNTSVKSSIDGLKLIPAEAQSPAMLECRLNRVGNQSVYGNVTVTFVPAQGPSRVVGIVDGVAVYTPNPSRVLRVVLQAPPGVTLQHGRLLVAFSKAEQNGERFAEATLEVP